MALGLSGSYALAESPAERDAWLADPVTVLAQRVARLARTWSPTR
jgi:glycerate kinase